MAPFVALAKPVPGDVAVEGLAPRSALELRYMEEGLQTLVGMRDTSLNYVATLARASAKAAYNIALVARFVRALRKRDIPVEMPLAPDGTPAFFQLPNMQRSATDPGSGVRLELLGPTKALVSKYKERLVLPPEALMLFRAVNYVTVPNKVSYVFALHANGASALFTGDSGFSDFYRDGAFDEARLERLRLPGLVKVPHHGGHFERFAQCFEHLMATAPRRRRPFAAQHFAISLGSDYVNPSEEFEQFAAKTVDAASAWNAPEFRFTNAPDQRRFDEVCTGCDLKQGPPALTYKASSDGAWTMQSPNNACCLHQRGRRAETEARKSLARRVADIFGLWRRS